MKIIIGLGNPGGQYADTRHNIGWMVLDRLADRAGWTGKGRTKDAAAVAMGRYDGLDITLVKPLTFMNDSGIAVRKVLARESRAAQRPPHRRRRLRPAVRQASISRGRQSRRAQRAPIDRERDGDREVQPTAGRDRRPDAQRTRPCPESVRARRAPAARGTARRRRRCGRGVGARTGRTRRRTPSTSFSCGPRTRISLRPLVRSTVLPEPTASAARRPGGGASDPPRSPSDAATDARPSRQGASCRRGDRRGRTARSALSRCGAAPSRTVPWTSRSISMRLAWMPSLPPRTNGVRTRRAGLARVALGVRGRCGDAGHEPGARSGARRWSTRARSVGPPAACSSRRAPSKTCAPGSGVTTRRANRTRRLRRHRLRRHRPRAVAPAAAGMPASRRSPTVRRPTWPLHSPSLRTGNDCAGSRATPRSATASPTNSRPGWVTRTPSPSSSRGPRSRTNAASSSPMRRPRGSLPWPHGAVAVPASLSRASRHSSSTRSHPRISRPTPFAWPSGPAGASPPSSRFSSTSATSPRSRWRVAASSHGAADSSTSSRRPRRCPSGSSSSATRSSRSGRSTPPISGPPARSTRSPSCPHRNSCDQPAGVTGSSSASGDEPRATSASDWPTISSGSRPRSRALGRLDGTRAVDVGDAAEVWAPILAPSTGLDHLEPGTLIVLDEPGDLAESAAFLWRQADERRAELIEAGDLPKDWPATYLAPRDWKARLLAARTLELTWESDPGAEVVPRDRGRRSFGRRPVRLARAFASAPADRAAGRSGGRLDER